MCLTLITISVILSQLLLCYLAMTGRLMFCSLLKAFTPLLSSRKLSGGWLSVNTKPSQAELLSVWHVGELSCFIITVLTITPRQGSLSVSLPAILSSSSLSPFLLLLLLLLSFYQAYAAWFLPWVAAPTQVGVTVV